jgi:hypothetical protein
MIGPKESALNDAPPTKKTTTIDTKNKKFFNNQLPNHKISFLKKTKNRPTRNPSISSQAANSSQLFGLTLPP